MTSRQGWQDISIHLHFRIEICFASIRIRYIFIDQRALKHLFVKGDVLARGIGVGKGFGTFFHNSPDLFIFSDFRQVVKIHGLLDGPKKTVGIEVFKQKTVAPVAGQIQINNGVGYPEGINIKSAAP
jgi:hypothetical protein